MASSIGCGSLVLTSRLPDPRSCVGHFITSQRPAGCRVLLEGRHPRVTERSAAFPRGALLLVSWGSNPANIYPLAEPFDVDEITILVDTIIDASGWARGQAGGHGSDLLCAIGSRRYDL
jgi:hypothetical protein